ncbi:UDP-N-acetylmuramoyl-L-alanyl-D-glutamate--2,6-diaminopimelate ligase [Sporosarcina jiandibaonis]|uniref:UDP-N-acetylmuramoyl-L-alanyl-D-glutamate--2, 6-diaminopimelate ligase n=1 Tax=Sporosarcina jiandibaonis TaxID=2715535 RepID=UPI001556BFA8
MLLLQELLKDWPCTIAGGNYRVAVKGITENSLDVKPGFIFVARKGNKYDGTFFIEEAISAGAVAIVIDKPIFRNLPNNVPIITVPDGRLFLSHASAELAQNPADHLTIIAVTGTNGKTTVSHFIGQLLMMQGIRVAVIGTTGIFIDGVSLNYDVPQMTTLSAEHLHPLLASCLENGVTHVVLEASSLGLSTYRLEHCKIDIGLLLNIGSDHYDEHGGKKSYIDAKKKLLLMARKVIVNRDDPVCVQMMQSVAKKCIYFGTHPDSDVCLKIEEQKLLIECEKERGEFFLPLLGEFNRMNAVAAVSVLHSLSYQLSSLLPNVVSLRLPEGRMQQLNKSNISVVIDYAHTPDALQGVLCSLMKTSLGRLITVFGCGGERDKGKRSEMGQIASFYSSDVIITTDNPRDEDPLKIIDDIITGITDSSKEIIIEPNRELAIQKAINMADSGDIVLIAGKGHEKIQHTAEGVFPFSDMKIAKQALFQKEAN